jgi:hypothetical protein
MIVTICRLYDTYSDASDVATQLDEAEIPQLETSIIANNADGWYPAGPRGAGVPVADQSTGARPTVSAPAGDQQRSAAPAAANDQRRDERGGRFESAAVGAAIGATAGTAAGVVTLLAIPGVGPIVGAGWLLALLGGAAVGGVTGGLLGALTKAGVSEEDAQIYAEGVRRGGTLVTARVPESDAGRVKEIMDGSAVDIRDRAGEYRRSGWRLFDPQATPYTADQVRNERELHRAA